MILYAFDIKTESLKSYNTVKRRFYYHLSKIEADKVFWHTKSVLAVADKDELTLDLFFAQFKDYLVLYKAKIDNMQKVY